MADAESPQQPKAVFSAFKKRSQNFSGRRKKRESSGSDEDESSAVKTVQRAGHKHKIIGNRSTGPKLLSKKVGNGDNSREESDNESEDDIVESKKKSKISVTYESSRTGKREGPDDMGATSTLEIDTEFDRDAQAIYEKQLQSNKEEKGQEDSKLYKGQSGYAKYYEKRDTAQGNAASGMVR